MPRSKEIPEDIRRKVVEAHETGKGYKLISKAIGLPKTTVRAILRKWKRFGTVVTLPRSGRPSKISLRARREIIREVMKNPCTTSKDLQATLASSNICVHHSTIRRILGIHGRPTMSSFDGSMALQTSGQEEGGVMDDSDKSTRDIKNEEELEVIKISNTNSDNTSKDNAKCTDDDDDNEEGAGHDKNCGDGEKTPANDNRDDEMASTDIKGAGGEHGVIEKCDDGGNGAETASASGGDADENEKLGDETSIVESRGSGDADDVNRQDSGYATDRDVNSAYDSSSSNNNNNNNNNNNSVGGKWSDEMDYISTLMFS
ncbi:putative mediator of RNA polymerase II transcription subunit 24 [Ictalurus punctatus]|uniref:Mediator of RNA polymerase II transcription subunit 24 n=1 Tax=Ictalurus punctatus TaxID=7998 RepID=A0A2D0Q8G3_ICTPU|nr:putative mediator of RNA polymerase II transcription subunit 24 [Ictalurus punctatus]